MNEQTHNTGLFVGLLLTLMFTFASTSITLLGAPYIVGALGGSAQIGIYAFAVFGIGNVIGLPLGKILIGRIEASTLLVTSLFLFAIASFGLALTKGFPSFLIIRFFEGFLSGTFYLSVFQIELNFFRKQRKRIFASWSSNLFSTVSGIAICVGAWVAYDYDWRYIFYFQAIGALLLSIFLWIQFHTIEGVDEAPLAAPVSGPSFIFYSIGIICLSFVCMAGQQFDWLRSPLINTLLACGLPCLTFALCYDLFHDNPLFELKMLKNPFLLCGLVFVCFLFSLYYTITSLLGAWLTLYANYTPIWLSLIVGIMVVAAIFFLVVEAKYPNIDPRIYVAGSLVSFGICCFYTTIFDNQINIERLILSRLFAGFGMNLFIAPLSRACMCLFPSNDKNEREIQLFFLSARLLGTSLGSPLYHILWQRREVFFHSRLSELDMSVSAQTVDFFHKAEKLDLSTLQTYAEFGNFLERRSFSLALDDVFYLLGWSVVGLFILLLISFKVRPIGQLSPRVLSAQTCKQKES